MRGIFPFFWREGGNRGLAGGESGIRTPEILWNPMDGIPPDCGALFSSKKSICAAKIAVTGLGD
jgi:hypothetical protein